MKQTYIALLENIFSRKKKKIVSNTVNQFRIHYTYEKIFKILKIEFLSSKKNKILKRVANDFRQERLAQGRAYVNTKPETVTNTEYM